MEIKKQAEMKSCLRPVPNVLVSCRGTDGRDNALAVGYCCNCSFDPPMVMVGIVPSRFSYSLIKESGCFVVNIPEKNYKEVFDFLGSKSGRDLDKLAEMNVRLEEAKMIDAPLLADCPVNIECKIVDSIVTGSHEMFAGRIEYVHARKDLLKEDGCIDHSSIDLL
jgi:flavin reductase (DIM6/NTAB) family NADH-FMN oxidoreductase RutF